MTETSPQTHAQPVKQDSAKNTDQIRALMDSKQYLHLYSLLVREILHCESCLRKREGLLNQTGPSAMN